MAVEVITRHKQRSQAEETIRVLKKGGEGSQDWIIKYRRFKSFQLQKDFKLPLTDIEEAWLEMYGAELEFQFGSFESNIHKAAESILKERSRVVQ